jgi:AcrR family transcriptional regulator/DNA-binding MarR family transcriptional regulator
VNSAQRARILDAMIRVVSENGVQYASVAKVVAAAGVSHRTFYGLFADRDACLLAAIEQGVALAAEHAHAGYTSHVRWVDRIRGGLFALLEFFEQEPKLADLCVVFALQASRTTLARRSEILAELAGLLDQGREDSRHQPPPLTAEMALGGALAIVHARLLERGTQPLTELSSALMSCIVLPYRGAGAARRELSRPIPQASPQSQREATPHPVDGVRLTYRTMRVLVAIASEPGVNNSQVSDRAGILDQGQVSKLLARLARQGLIENGGDRSKRNAVKAWRLTRAGEQLERSIRHEVRRSR